MWSLLAAGLALATVQKAPDFGPEQAWELLDALVPAQMRRDQAPGAAVALVMDGEVAFLEAYGLARVEPETPFTADGTILRMGSVSKTFTTMALARALERRGLALDAQVAPHLDGLAIRATRAGLAPLSFRHLFTHTGGFDQIGLERQALDEAAQLSPRQFLEGRLVLVRAPGVVPVYDTYGITLAGHLVERLSGKPFARALREELFVPLGMQRTFVQTPAELRGELALGYGLEDGRLYPQPYEWYNTQPASSVDSTAADVARWMIALLGGEEGKPRAERVFAPETLALLREPQFRAHPDLPGFSLGFWEEWHGAERAVWHGGTMLGFSTRLTLFPERRIGLFTACNRDGETGPPPALHDNLLEALVAALAQRVVAPEVVAEHAPLAEELDLARFEGSYADACYCHTCPEGRGWPWRPLELRASGASELEFLGSRWRASEPLVFRRAGGDPLVFRADALGRITHAFVGNFAFERIGEALLDETLGEGWREREEDPFVRRVLAHRPGAARERLAPARDLALPAELRARLAGRYRTDAGLVVEATERGAELWIVVPGSPDRRLLWQGELAFRVQGEDAARVDFEEDGGRVAVLVFHDDDGTPHALTRVD